MARTRRFILLDDGGSFNGLYEFIKRSGMDVSVIKDISELTKVFDKRAENDIFVSGKADPEAVLLDASLLPALSKVFVCDANDGNVSLKSPYDFSLASTCTLDDFGSFLGCLNKISPF